MTFKPKVTYYSAMDFILYLTEDVSYRTEYVDSLLEILWHPQEDRMVGVKVSNVQLINRWFDNGDHKELHLDKFMRCAMGLTPHDGYALAQAAARYCHACEVFGGTLIPDTTRRSMKALGDA